jgi:stage V sporulation protein G
MNITDIKIRSVNPESRMKAVVSVTFDGDFVVHDMKIIEGPERCFLAMPSRKAYENGFRDIVHPINAEFRVKLEQAVMEKYNEMQTVAQNANELPDSTP